MSVNGGDKQYGNRKPNYDLSAAVSRDGKYWIIKQICTWVVPYNYLDKIRENHLLETALKNTGVETKTSKRIGRKHDRSDAKGN